MNTNNQPRKYVTEQDVLKKHHKFLRESESQSQNSSNQQKQRSARKNTKSHNIYHKYGQQMAKKYYSKLYKQYALIDLSRYETAQIGCRWRTQKEVIMDKGQKVCGAVDCSKQATQVYEMNFGYKQQGMKKNALVKVSVCTQCGKKLNHKKQHKRVVKLQQDPNIDKKQRKDNKNP